MTLLTSVTASQRLDSRGKPTVQVEVRTADGKFRAIVPSGASKGDYEAVEKRDGGRAFGGNGVLEAVKNVEEIIGPALIAQRFDLGMGLKELDNFMVGLDGSSDKSHLGANAILGVSMACARACAAAKNIPLYEFLARETRSRRQGFVMPVPFLNVLNGGVHSGNPMAFQEFMIAPTGAPSFAQGIQWAAEVYQELKSIITKTFGKAAIGIGDEGGFAPPIYQPHEALDLIMAAIKSAGYEGRFKIGIDPASTEFFREGEYDLGFKSGEPRRLSSVQLMDLYQGLVGKYPIALLEDPFAQDDWDSWSAFNKICKASAVELVGDDLLATNIRRIDKASKADACNSLLLKVNQIGTVSEAISAAERAYELGWSVFVSHRSGETTDDFIADLAVGIGCGHLKSGAPCRGERVAKYNRLMDIEEELEAKKTTCSYAGEAFRYAHTNTKG
ncbi:phosphopyruvate hydratase [Cladophialophora bantiana CBS 173.52]|uniref:Enolase n=1 Tax=Cladophialophora bantiana (strain ATCC 10958 / CBS 173.52 / CDC B-1940 / NIH 8579) TaxID=1442370 RepID=A0A0D2G558_CLAB1|nr:phosphopyruvate hydratase [Cladophialophora bantiana CBS 173.52]KIW93767.1 phosphopyruvate hydratase [Cladophialophora bantiana CBS 173.52]